MKNYVFRIYCDDMTEGFMGLLVNIPNQEELFWKIDELGFNPFEAEFMVVKDICALSVPIKINEEEFEEELFNYIENDVNDITFNDNMSDNVLNGSLFKFKHNYEYKIEEVA